MRIVFLSPAAERGGAESVLVDIIKGIRETRPTWALHLIAGEDGPLLEQVRSLGATADVLAFSPFLRAVGEGTSAVGLAAKAWRSARLITGAIFAFLYQRKLRRHLVGLRPDLVH